MIKSSISDEVINGMEYHLVLSYKIIDWNSSNKNDGVMQS